MNKYSIIIPVYNGEKYIQSCINNILDKEITGQYELEVLVIDDCSTDNTQKILNNYQEKSKIINIYSTETNGGPGIARNIGLQQASGDWILFLDSDDKLCDNAFSLLDDFINQSTVEFDLVSFNFEYDNNSTIQATSGRKDLSSLTQSKKDLLCNYLSLQMDGSVIYTLFSRKLLKENKINFSDGIHEDIDFMFKSYAISENIGIFDYPLYIKNNREGSIVNTISINHFNGFFRAYNEMYNYLLNQNIMTERLSESFIIGIIGLCATRVREVFIRQQNNSKKLYLELYNNVLNILNTYSLEVKVPILKTKYYLIYEYLMKVFQNGDSNIITNINNFMKDILKKSWSCYDLHHSLFLAPNEVRTCCKRFFVDSKIKGDVPLLTSQKYDYSNFTVDNIKKEKNKLYTKINKGISDECNGCPFLEFKDWGSIDSLEMKYLSFEYHSVCNMKCTYCSDIYYGGKQSKYDVVPIVDELIKIKSLENCDSIVWGGGEPTLDKDFIFLMQKIALSFPTVKQRLITNATLFLDEVDILIKKNKVSIVTSIDSGTKEVFQLVRKNKNFDVVFENLRKYSNSKAENITIKYIVLDENRDIDEIIEFVKVIKKYGLEGCNFQISFDFKKESVDLESATAIIILYGKLIEIGVNFVFFDDLLRSRFENISKDFSSIYQKLKELDYHWIIANNQEIKNIVIWGAGNQTKSMLNNTHFFKDANVSYLVDNTPEKIGSKFMGYNVFDPKLLKDNDFPIIISAVQSTPKILVKFKELGLDEKRIIKKIII